MPFEVGISQKLDCAKSNVSLAYEKKKKFNFKILEK